MKYNKKASANISRRNFAKTVATSVITASLISAHPRKGSIEHIPPIEICSGSVALHTKGPVGGHLDGKDTLDTYPRKYVIKRGAQIKSIRVINTNGTILADYYGNNLRARGGHIKIWINKPITGNANMVLRTEGVGAGISLQLQIDNKTNTFDSDPSSCPTSYGKERRTYSDRNARLWKVSIYGRNGDLLKDVVTYPDNEIEIDRILIWTEDVAEYKAQSPQNKPR